MRNSNLEKSTRLQKGSSETASYMKNDIESEPPWYKQFWPWMLISLPATTVVAGIITMVIAVKNPNSMVKDNYYKEGLAINSSQEKERRALQLGIQLTLLKDKNNRVNLRLSSKKELVSHDLRVELIHPTQQHKDLSWELSLGNEQNTTLESISEKSKRWYVRVSDARNEWQLSGTWLTEQTLTLGREL